MSNIEGDLTGLDPKQIELITSAIEEHGFADAKITIKAVGEVGDNYVANVKRIIAEKDCETFSMVAKVAPPYEKRLASSNTHDVFYNEYVMYNDVLAKFAKMEEEAQIPQNERLRFAKFYGGMIDEPLEMILLEDLQVPGFVLLDRFKPLPNEAVRLVLKSFAILHSRSYVLRNNEPSTFAAFKAALKNPWLKLNEDENLKLFLSNLEEDAINMLAHDRHKAAVINTCGSITELSLNLYETDLESKYSVIQQGDSWTNNIMFRLEDESPEECCMIDYQLARVNSPVADLHYMILACTDYETRCKHFTEWIDYYHSELEKNLVQFGLKVDNCYPREQLDADLKRHGKLSLAQAIMLASVLTREKSDAANMKEAMGAKADDANFDEIMTSSRMSSSSDGTTLLFKTRVGGVIDSLQELGYILI